MFSDTTFPDVLEILDFCSFYTNISFFFSPYQMYIFLFNIPNFVKLLAILRQSTFWFLVSEKKAEHVLLFVLTLLWQETFCTCNTCFSACWVNISVFTFVWCSFWWIHLHHNSVWCVLKEYCLHAPMSLWFSEINTL